MSESTDMPLFMPVADWLNVIATLNFVANCDLFSNETRAEHKALSDKMYQKLLRWKAATH